MSRDELISDIIEQVFQLIRTYNGKFDLVDISLNFCDYTADIPCLAVSKLVESGRIERREIYGNRCAYFIKD